MAFNNPGAIVRMRLRNFMTYNDVSLSPGPNLNMIIGPNGTGKSAIVCSIIVGLAGDVSLTGRANNITSLVQRGCEWASTEIELFNSNGRNHVIERKITITSRAEGKIEHKSEWKMNGSVVPKRNIQQLIGELNIKVDNLCQFLPQDSVASFVKMGPSELLINTLKAAGDSQLVDDLNNLILLTTNISDKTAELESLQKTSAENEVNARRLEAEVQELQVREKLVRQRTLCSLKIHYIRYIEALEACDKAKDELKNKEDNLRQQRSCGEPVQEKIKHYKAAEIKYREEYRKKVEESKRVIELVRRNTANLENLKMKCQEEYAKFSTITDEEERRKRQLALKQQELHSHKCRLDEIKDVDYTKDIADLKAHAKQVQASLMAKAEEKDSIRQELRQLIIQINHERGKRAELVSVKEKRLNFVVGKKRDYQRVFDWLAINKDSFQKPILLPMFCDLDIKKVEFADVVEYTINEQDLYAFVCQTDEDLKKFTQHAHDVLNARVNVILQPDKSVEDFENEISNRGQNPYHGMDFAGFLKDMVEAPEPIMRYLYGQYNFHRVPVFNNLKEAEMKQMMDTCPRFFSKKTHYSIQKSRYDQERTVFNEKIREAALLKHSGFNKKKLEELDEKIESLNRTKIELEEKIKTIDQECHGMQQKFAELNRRCSELNNKQNEKERIQRTIEMCSKKIEELEAEKVDVESEQAKLRDSIKAINHKSLENLGRLRELFESYAIMRKTHLLNAMLAVLARKNYRLIESNYEKAMEEAKRLEGEIKEDQKRIDDLRSRVSRFKQEADEKIPGFKNGKLDSATKQKFAGIEHETVESLERYQEELKARIQGMQGVVGNQLLSEFHRQTQELKDKRKQMAELEEAISSMTGEQAVIKERFLSKLDDVITVIDEHYQEFMSKLNYGGKVELYWDTAHPDDFSSYGINIMVKYRDDEQLIPLSSTRQSGGERSVATMIYMLALQTKTTVPFRVVDEINQGMDKDNERKVFELLVRTAEESSSQYFLVSPKLLSGLNYGDQMQIHVVFNGPQLHYSFDGFNKENRDEAYASESEDEEDRQVVAPIRRSRR
uniref:Structural maintenance of chromosomes protein 5 n=1 Tax=Aceria tosichella TaxID=561515 RepID=A0A6G1SB21_9ACAR